MTKFVIKCTRSDDDRFTVGGCYEVNDEGYLVDNRNSKTIPHPNMTYHDWYRACYWENYSFELMYEAPAIKSLITLEEWISKNPKRFVDHILENDCPQDYGLPRNFDCDDDCAKCWEKAVNDDAKA